MAQKLTKKPKWNSYLTDDKQYKLSPKHQIRKQLARVDRRSSRPATSQVQSVDLEREVEEWNKKQQQEQVDRNLKSLQEKVQALELTCTEISPEICDHTNTLQQHQHQIEYFEGSLDLVKEEMERLRDRDQQFPLEVSSQIQILQSQLELRQTQLQEHFQKEIETLQRQHVRLLEEMNERELQYQETIEKLNQTVKKEQQTVAKLTQQVQTIQSKYQELEEKQQSSVREPLQSLDSNQVFMQQMTQHLKHVGASPIKDVNSVTAVPGFHQRQVHNEKLAQLHQYEPLTDHNRTEEQDSMSIHNPKLYA